MVTRIFVTASCTPGDEISNFEKKVSCLGLGEQKERSEVTRTWELGGQVLCWPVHGSLVEALHTAPVLSTKSGMAAGCWCLCGDLVW